MAGQPRRLYRSYINRVFAGICGGLGEYFNIDPTLVRILWLLLVFVGGTGLLLYLIGIFVIPKRPIMIPAEGPTESLPSVPASTSVGKVFGAGFVILGILLLLDNLDLVSFHDWWHRSWEFLLPALLVGGGIYIILRKNSTRSSAGSATGGAVEESPAGAGSSAGPGATDGGGARPKRLHRSRSERKLFGICGGMAEYLEIDPTIVRVLYVAFTLMSAGAGIVLYLLLSLVIPEEPINFPEGV